MPKKKVCLFTTFFESTSGYSLIGVAETQIRMLLDHGYETRVLVQNPCAVDETGKVKAWPYKEQPPPSVWNRQAVDLRAVVPPLPLEPGIAEDFEERVDLIEAALVEHLDGCDVCITHDIVLQDFYKEHNVAMRRYAETRPDLLWLHWIHSCPSSADNAEYPNDCRHTPPPGYIIYPNGTDKARVCQAYKLAGQEWRVKVCRAGHAIDPLLIWPYQSLTKDLAREADLLGGDIVVVYPARLDKGKQPEKIIRLLAGVQKAGYEPRLLIVDWQSMGQRFLAYKKKLARLARKLGLEGKVHFTSRLDDRCSQGVPRQVVMELMDLSNVYVHSSRVETYSLVVHEAALRGLLLVLNHDFPAMRELFGETALYMDFGSDRNKRSYKPNEQQFWNDEALRLLAEFKKNRSLVAKTTARRQWTPQALWKDFAPLLYLPAVGGA